MELDILMEAGNSAPNFAVHKAFERSKVVYMVVHTLLLLQGL